MKFTELSDYRLPAGTVTEWAPYTVAPESEWVVDLRPATFDHEMHLRRSAEYQAGNSWLGAAGARGGRRGSADRGRCRHHAGRVGRQVHAHSSRVGARIGRRQHDDSGSIQPAPIFGKKSSTPPHSTHATRAKFCKRKVIAIFIMQWSDTLLNTKMGTFI